MDKRLNTIMNLYGYKTNVTDFFETNSYKKLREVMLDNLPFGDLRRFSFDFYPLSEVLSSGKYVIDKHFGNLDLRVKYAKGDEFETRLVAMFGTNPKPDKYDDIIDFINNQIDLINVTAIPVSLNTNSDITGGYTSTSYFYGIDQMNEDYYKKLPVCIKGISLEGACNENVKCTYVHEMAHALINRHKYNINNYLNTETFSIFMEKVAAEDIDSSGELLDMKSFYRIIQSKNNMLDMEIRKFNEMDYTDILEDQKYIISTLHATALFQTYLKGSNKIKKEINSSLGKVIMGIDTLEEVLDHYDATLDRGTNIMKRQIKRYQTEIEKRR